MKLHVGLCVVAMAWTSPAAHADAVSDAASTLRNNATRWVTRAKKDLDANKSQIEQCREAEAKLRKAAAPTYVMTDSDLEGYPKAYKDKDGTHLKRDDVGVICDELEKLLPLSELRELVQRAYYAIDMIGGRAVSAINTEEHLQMYEQLLKDCKAAVGTFKAAGVTKVGDWKIDEIDPKVCDPLAKVMVQYRIDVAAAVAEAKAARAALEKSYKAVGISGEKMEFLIDMDAKALYGVGGKELTTPKAKTASVMFSVSTGSDGGVTVTRYQFKGNTHTKTVSKDYPLGRPGPSAFK